MAAGDTLDKFVATSLEPLSANTATLDTRNQHPVLDFDGSTNESAVFRGIMPQHYGGGGWDVILHVSHSSDITNDTDWDIQVERTSDGTLDIDSDSFATTVETNGTAVPGTAGIIQKITCVLTSGQIDGVTAGDSYRLKVRRDAASDDSTTDAELSAVEIREN